MLLSGVGLAVVAGCAEVNDWLMAGLFPANELSVDANFDAKHPPKILKVVPDEIVAQSEAEVTIHGNYLKSMQTNDLGEIWLSLSGRQPIPGRIVRQVSNEIRVRFDLAGVTGTWDLHLRRADGPETLTRRAVRVVHDRQ